MNTATKSYLLIISTLFIGFAAGYLTNGYVLRQKVDRARHLVQGGDEIVERLITDLELDQPTADQVRPILTAHFSEVKSLQQGFRQEMRAHMGELMESLAPILTEDQLKQFRRHLRPIRGRQPGPGRHRGPPPPHPSDAP